MSWKRREIEGFQGALNGSGMNARAEEQRRMNPASEGASDVSGEDAGFLRRLFLKIRGLWGKSFGDAAAGAPSEPPPPEPPDWRREPPERDLFGLALSGGGIRSATFNLGILQELRRRKVLTFDYLATVSGGGYLGGFWSAWLRRQGGAGGPRDPAVDFPGDGPTPERPEPPEIRHLRDFSNFLSPRRQILSYESGRLIAAFAVSVLPCLAISLAFVLLSLLGWWLLAWLLTAEAAGRWTAVEGLVPGLLALGVTLAVQGGFEIAWWRRKEEPQARALPSYVAWAAFSGVGTGAFGLVLWYVAAPPERLLRPLTLDGLGAGLAAALLPAAAWLGMTLLLVLLRTLHGFRQGRTSKGRARLAALDRVLVRTLLVAAAWGVIGAFWVVGQLLAGVGVAGLLAAAGTAGAGGGTFAWARQLFTDQVNLPTGGRLQGRLKPWLFQVLAYLTLGAVSAAAASLLVLLAGAAGTAGLLWSGGVAAAVVAGSLLFFDPNEAGFHAFYRDRLVRAYLGASNRGARPRATAPAENDDPRLDELPRRPLHLVCCTANDLAGDPLGNLHRGAESAVLSRYGLQVGNRFAPWPGGPPASCPTLGDAVAASGAAVDPHMGALSARLGRAVAFLLAALGIRLGMWIENPKGGSPGKGRPRGWLFIRELLSLSWARSRWVRLSDGAYYENLALYELVRRHCRFILLSDCGSDPDRAFDDFGNAVRRIREDFGVEIDIDVTPLRPGDGGLSRQPMVAGTIRYPPSPDAGENDLGDEGVLLYVKPTLTGDEPADVAQYAERNERFPHETTADQFYDEAQWESYRRLGEHVAKAALRPVAEWLPGPGRRAYVPERLFLRAAYHWAPLNDEPELGSLEEDWERLEDRVLTERQLRTLRDQLLMPRLPDRAWTASRSPDLVSPIRVPPGLRRLLAAFLGRRPADRRAAPRPEDLVAALPAIREALRLMAAVHDRTEFGRNPRAPSHRRYMGWLNRIGCWASAPLFRAWWPWLAPAHGLDFKDFMERIFRLGVDLRKVTTVTWLDGDDLHGYAGERWRAGRQGRTLPGELYGCFLDLGTYEPLHAALIELAVRGPVGGRQTASWKAGDLYVAPGLWGLGVGEAFLDELLHVLARHGYERAEVTGPSDATADALYMGAGFRREAADDSRVRFVRDLRSHP